MAEELKVRVVLEWFRSGRRTRERLTALSRYFAGLSDAAELRAAATAHVAAWEWE